MDKISPADIPNEVFLAPEGFVEFRMIGEQSYQKIEKTAMACRRFIDLLNYQHKPLLGLVDLSEDHSINPGTNKATLKALEEIPYQRAAMFGASPIMTEVTRALIAALGKGANTKIFGTREEAEAWLLMKDPLEG